MPTNTPRREFGKQFTTSGESSGDIENDINCELDVWSQATEGVVRLHFLGVENIMALLIFIFVFFLTPHLDHHLLPRGKHSGGQLESLRDKILAKDSGTLLLHGHVFILE